MITVKMNKFHGGREIYKGTSLPQAIKTARKHDCTRSGNCIAGPVRTNDKGETLCEWEATPPFIQGMSYFWG